MSGMTTSPRHARFVSAKVLIKDNPLLVVIAGIGFAVSFQTIADLARAQHMPGNPVLYPVLIDVGFLAAVIEERHAIRDGRSDIAPRVLAWLLGALTIYVNAHGSPSGDWLGLSLHVAGPALWIAFLELTRWRKIRKAKAPGEEEIARADARRYAIDLLRAELGRRWRLSAPRLMRRQVVTGRLPHAVTAAVRESVSSPYADPWEPVVERWVVDGLTKGVKVAAEVTREKQAIRASAVASEPAGDDTLASRQTARQADSSSRAQKQAKVRRLLTDGKARTTADVARLAGVSESTVDRIKRSIRPRAVNAADG